MLRSTDVSTGMGTGTGTRALAKLKLQLRSWERSFATKHGRMPDLNDIALRKNIELLYKAYSKQKKLHSRSEAEPRVTVATLESQKNSDPELLVEFAPQTRQSIETRTTENSAHSEQSDQLNKPPVQSAVSRHHSCSRIIDGPLNSEAPEQFVNVNSNSFHKLNDSNGETPIDCDPAHWELRVGMHQLEKPDTNQEETSMDYGPHSEELLQVQHPPKNSTPYHELGINGDIQMKCVDIDPPLDPSPPAQPIQIVRQGSMALRRKPSSSRLFEPIVMELDATALPILDTDPLNDGEAFDTPVELVVFPRTVSAPSNMSQNENVCEGDVATSTKEAHRDSKPMEGTKTKARKPAGAKENGSEQKQPKKKSNAGSKTLSNNFCKLKINRAGGKRGRGGKYSRRGR
ncbi:hypothetical protein BJ742DRAFT_838189 [Cladochytrium replicatum]|nr:hypothetical protein BJ742DRAFT_838189 [Cladochytrium replicatum]